MLLSMSFCKRLIILSMVIFCSFPLFPSKAQGYEEMTERQRQIFEEIDWQEGAFTANLGTIARIYIPESFVFVGEKDMPLLNELSENLGSENDMGAIFSPTGEWVIYFIFNDVGYVRDNEKEDLDADAILQTLKENNEQANAERRKRGWSPMQIVGWAQSPHYDSSTHNLEWALLFEEKTLNLNVRFLGRNGYMSVVLVTDPDGYQEILPKFKTILSTFEYNPNEKYEAFKQGDKIAKLGLTSLIIGGATAVAVKSGLFKHVWKLLVLLFVAIGGVFKKIFGRKSE